MSDNKKPANLDLSALLEEERPTVTMPDGKVYEFIVQGDLGAVEYAQLKRYLKIVMRAMVGLVDLKNDDEEEAKELDKAVDRLLALILPEVPSEVWADPKLKLGAKAKIFEFWTEKTGMGEGSQSTKEMLATIAKTADQMGLAPEVKEAFKARVNEAIQQSAEAQESAPVGE